MKYRKYFRQFIQALDHKLERGYHEYGDRSFDEHETNTIEQMEEECLDICGWGLILWARLEELKKKVITEAIK